MSDTFTKENNQRDNGKKYVTVNSIDQVIYTPRLAKHTHNYQDIVPYGNFDNLYPQKIIEVAQKSWATSTALSTYYDFMVGDGFGDEDELIINEKNQSLFDLLTFISQDKSKLGFAVHVNYNAKGVIIEMQSIDFEDLRFNEDGKIVYNPDWSNRYATENKEKETIYNLFNPDTAVEEANEVGWDEYTGQVFYYTGTNKLYPLATFDAALEAGQYQADEELFKLRNIQNGFSLSGMFVYPKNVRNTKEGKAIIDSLEGDGSGANNSGRFTVMGVPAGVEGIEKITQFIPFERSNIDGLYTNQNKESTGSIFSIFRQPPILNAISESGMFNQQSLQDAFVFYNSIVEKDRKQIEKVLNFIMSFSTWGNLDLEIRPKMLINADDIESATNELGETIGGEDDQLRKEAQAKLKGTVGGVDGILAIQEKVSQGITQYSSGLKILTEIYGFEDETAKQILGEPVEKFDENVERVDETDNGNNTDNTNEG